MKRCCARVALSAMAIMALSSAPSFADVGTAASQEASYLAQIQSLDEQAKKEPNIDQATELAKQAIAARRSLAALYHKEKQFEKIPALYDEILKRDEQLVWMDRMSKADIAADYKYIAGIYTFLGNDSLAKKMNLKAAAAQPTPDASGKNASSYLEEIGKQRMQGLAAMKKGDLQGAQLQFEKALRYAQDNAEPELKRKMLEHVAGYTLDDWHACLLKQAELNKDLADIWYKRGDLDQVQALYERMVVLKDMGGVTLADRAKDYAYLVTVCDANGAVEKAILYNISLLKARRSTSSEQDPNVVATMDGFAKYLRKVKQDEKAAMLEARAKAVRSGSKQLPKLWFSF